VTKRRDCSQRFEERYAAQASEAALIVEREVIGANVGANGYTTLRQADMLAERLHLSPQSLLLDIGCGRGWPGLYLSEKTGCRVVLSDIPLPALGTALRTSDKRAMSERVSVVRASATDAPFARHVFDAVTHTDAL
jgi:cyclopropane fatty-acyl-phospholipid synthase-like methyltransferase